MSTDIQAWLDQDDARLATTIRKHGWSIEYIGGDTCGRPGCDDPGGDGPTFAYTVGLFGLAHPELLIFSVSQRIACLVLNALGEQIRGGEPVLSGHLIELEHWSHRIIPEAVPNPAEIVFGANRYYQRPDEASVPLIQLSYDDVRGLFPWEAGHLRLDRQPRPGTFKA